MYKSIFSFLFIFLTTLNLSAAERPLRYVLIHGGGIGGLAPIFLLKHMEKEINRPIASVIDGVAGTSTGAMTAASICGPTPSFSTESFPTEFVQFARSTFSPSNIALRKSDSALDVALQKQFGGSYMSQSKCHLSIISFDRKNSRDVIFDSELAKNPENDLLVWQAVRASASIDVPFFGPLSSGTVQYNNSLPQGGFSDPELHDQSDPVSFLIKRISERHPGRGAIIFSLGTGTTKRESVTQVGKIMVMHLEPDYNDVLGTTFGRLRYTMSVSNNMSAPNIDDIEARAKKMLTSRQFKSMLRELTTY